MKSRQTLIGLTATLFLLLVMSACQRAPQKPVAEWVQTLFYKDDFDAGLDNWFIEREKGGEVNARDGRLDIDVPAGCTVWFRPKLKYWIAIEYDATAIQAGGANDRVSDLNCFWMASDPWHPDDFFAATKRQIHRLQHAPPLLRRHWRQRQHDYTFPTLYRRCRPATAPS